MTATLTISLPSSLFPCILWDTTMMNWDWITSSPWPLSVPARESLQDSHFTSKIRCDKALEEDMSKTEKVKARLLSQQVCEYKWKSLGGTWKCLSITICTNHMEVKLSLLRWRIIHGVNWDLINDNILISQDLFRAVSNSSAPWRFGGETNFNEYFKWTVNYSLEINHSRNIES